MFAQRYHAYHSIPSYDIETNDLDKNINHISLNKYNHSWKYYLSLIIIVSAMMLVLLSLGIHYATGIHYIL